MFCGAALTFPNSGYGLLVVAMSRMVIVVVAGGGRDSCAQVLRNSRLSPPSAGCVTLELQSAACGVTVLVNLFASWFSDNLAGRLCRCSIVRACKTVSYSD